jgi:chaperonin GroES
MATKAAPKAAPKTSLVPLADRIVITPLKQDEVTASGLVIPDTVKEKPQQGEVVAVGPGRLDDNGKRIALDVSVGDRILYAKYTGTEIKLDGEDYIVLNDKDILALSSRTNEPRRHKGKGPRFVSLCL